MTTSIQRTPGTEHRLDSDAGTNAERLLAHFDRIADGPDAVPRLRRFILDLAVRGKLVPQDPDDEPASELLKRIAAEKPRLVEAGEIRKPRELGRRDAITVLFEIPQSWQWIRLDSVGAIIGGGTPSANEAVNFAEPGQGIPWLTPADLGRHSELFISRGSRDLTEKGLQSSSATLMPGGTVLFTSRAPIGYVAIAANPISTNQGFKSIVPYVPDCSRFIALAMECFAPEIDERAPGTTFREVSGKIVAGVPFPLPPLAEQHRIVAKVDELMALCDRLETARTGRETTRNRLAAASLARLNAPVPDPAAFRNDAAFALDNLTPLTIRPDQIKALRQTILNLAVRGKLVPQDPNDEPASELLKRIAAEKARLVKTGEMKVRNVRARDRENELEFVSPLGWAMSKLSEIAIKITDGAHKTPTYVDRGIPFVSVKDFSSGALNLENTKRITPEEHQSLHKRCDPRRGDILLGRIGTLGKAVLVATDAEFSLFVSVGLIRFEHCHTVPEYLCLALNSPFVEAEFDRIKIGGGTHTNKLNLGDLHTVALPLPPLAEQHRIVAKVDELMALCERLEASLTTGDETRGRLLESVLHEALEVAADGDHGHD